MSFFINIFLNIYMINLRPGKTNTVAGMMADNHTDLSLDWAHTHHAMAQ